MKLALRSAAFALLALPVFSQRVGTGTIRGSASRGVTQIQVRITGTVERAGAPAANVSVTTGAASTQTDASGAFSLTQIAPLGSELVVTAAARIVGENWRASALFPVRSQIRAGTLALEPRSVSIPFAPLCAPGGQVWADLDGDTDLDFVARSSGGFTVFRNAGDGFEALVQSTAIDAGDLRLLDLDLDGDADLVVQQSVSQSLFVLQNGGSGAFGAPHPIEGDFPIGVSFPFVLGDFDGDGPPDLVAAASGTLTFLHGRGNGTFAAPLVQSGPVGASQLTAADFDGDGRRDLALAVSNALTIALGDGDGTFTLPPSLPLAHDARQLIPGDVDGDGVIDLLAWTSSTSPSFAYYAEPLLGNGDATFTTAPVFSLATSTGALGLADLDLDGDDDMLQSFSQGGAISSAWFVLRTSFGDGTFEQLPLPRYDIGASGSLAGVADFDADGKPDVIVAGSPGTGIFLGRGDGTLIYPAHVDADFGASNADYDGDGDLDVLCRQYSPARVQLSGNDGHGAFALVGPAASVATFGPAATGDLDGDGDLDVAVVNSSIVTVLSNDGALHLGASASFSGVSVPAPAFADFDRDGDLDLAIATQLNGGVLQVRPGNGDGTFGAPTSTFIGAWSYSLVAGDWNADLVPDVAFAKQFPSEIVVRTGNGDGTFQAQVAYAANGAFLGPQSVCDLDGDGALDLVTEQAVLLGHGNGVFDAALALGLTAQGIADLGGDGLLDVVRTSAERVDVFVGHGDGTFAAQRSYLRPYAPSGATGLLLGDFDGDGDCDVLLSDTAWLMRGLRMP